VNLNLSGVRNEHNTTTSYVRDRPFLSDDQYEGAPIYPWDITHVLAYCDKYSLPVDPLYRYHPSGTGYPWHGVVSEERSGEQVTTERALWFRTRQTCVEYGYTSFWERIIEYFPDAELKAVTHASEKGLDYVPIEDGYELGSDANPIVPDWFSP
jgi:3'-phosphoadenosine 5'-phosphosulfate sulfotransferase (PAPS reductase)/FAD synthetase